MEWLFFLLTVVGTLSRVHSVPDPDDQCSCNCNISPLAWLENDCQWEMVFKAVKGNGRSPQHDFREGGSINEGNPKAMDINSDKVYRNSAILDKWTRLVITKVKIDVFNMGLRKAWFVFNGIGTNIGNWMKQDRLIASSYNGVKSDKLPFFSLTASPDTSFLIQTNYDACHTDCGYLAVVEPRESNLCDWQNLEADPYFVIGNNSDSCSTHNNSGESEICDRFVISVRVCDLED